MKNVTNTEDLDKVLVSNSQLSLKMEKYVFPQTQPLHNYIYIIFILNDVQGKFKRQVGKYRSYRTKT